MQILFKGVNVVEYCKCKGFSECSTQWDPYDGKSITQAQSDQYKVSKKEKEKTKRKRKYKKKKKRQKNGKSGTPTMASPSPRLNLTNTR